MPDATVKRVIHRKPCQHCGSYFTRPPRVSRKVFDKRKHCSYRCTGKAHLRFGVIQRKPCEVCGSHFTKQEPEGAKAWAKRKFCSYDCYYRTLSGRTESNSASWRGDQIGNRGIHARLMRYRGEAREHDCVMCGGSAKDWALRWDRAKALLPDPLGLYSLDLNDYDPMCRSCHHRFDLSRHA